MSEIAFYPADPVSPGKPTATCAACGASVTMGFTDCERLFCDEHSAQAGEDAREFRTCGWCGLPMTDGMTDLEGFYSHEGECFKALMDSEYGTGLWRLNRHEDAPLWDGGYYDHLDDDGAWEDTGVFYTQWD